MGIQDLVVALRGGTTDKPAFKLGTIPVGYVSGNPTIIFDGETTASTKAYPVADHVTTLAAGKSVLVAMTGMSSGLIVAAFTRP